MLLAMTLGRHDVDAMLREMTAEQFAEWEQFYQLEPFGPWRDNVHAAMISQQVHNVLGGKAKLKNFILDFSGKPKPDDGWVRALRAWSDVRQCERDARQAGKKA